ncbi:DeoR/GlpR family DNA-binding transcription regulator [Chitinophaga sp. XS-30]|uniref:DeoR/GlpR family DNA-binding transcription regulator n=1 Tax=Chitinophaga sp. XS-30 TaxID=2604421 RepID=UPI0011DDEC91|nr:DeoR/GlpR family DNA-binding transcription regulator [Chitinophaga sp. XS-30]QEH41618.1 DeoR/GlpR transcriptional regulator [Chitinophaga sp. XS-30]
MLKKERQSFILRQVNLHNKVLSVDLSQQMDVSEDTIRRDLNEMAEQGKLIKVHGGALSKSFHLSIASDNVYALSSKKHIAMKASRLIKDGMFVLTTGGTTIIELAKALPPELSATFITVSLPAAYEYIHHPNIEVIFLGDRISKSSQISIGGSVVSRIKGIRADLCFLGINAIDVQHGITDNDWEVVEVKKAMIESSERVVSLAIAEKLDTAQRIKVCDITRISTLITELEPGDRVLKPYRDTGIEIL